MEFPTLGEHCQESTCKMLDFLPFRCDSCKKVFCKDHIHYEKHNCDKSGAKVRDFQVPLCPLCNTPVPYKRNELPDAAMSAHIDRDCKSDPAEERRKKVYSNKCSLKGCKQKELIPFTCQKCKRNYCIRHRHENDHECDKMQSQSSANSIKTTSRESSSSDLNSKRLLFFQKQQQQQPQQTQQRPTHSSNISTRIQPNSMSENEALEYAIRLSLAENNKEKNTAHTETEDEMLARVLAQSEQEYLNRQNRTTTAENSDKKESCSIH